MRETKRLISGVSLPLAGALSLSSRPSPPMLELAFADHVTCG